MVSRKRVFISFAWAAVACLCAPALSAASLPPFPVEVVQGIIPQDVIDLGSLSSAELERRFAEAPEPTSLPSGFAVGLHKIPSDSQAKVPFLPKYVALHDWRAKYFDAKNSRMIDILNTHTVLGSVLSCLNLETQAVVSIGTAHDGRLAVITDYRPVNYGGFPRNELMNDAKGWVDEFREVESGLWLGRSFYRGVLWGYVILDLVSGA